ncbi:MAG: thiamine pyrophosphate-binding protein [Geminicoccaceae bacterium]|nr:thiamine pyrophosphate-binding protein [Geminicoccaceae bacterium]
MTVRSGGRILIDGLVAQGTGLVFGVAGESYLAALDAMADAGGLRFVACRQEGGAAMMAEAHGKLSGRPGVAFVTRGPGATNAAAGLHVASQDSTPMLLLVGQVARGMRGREAFQELDYRAVFGTMAKWVAEADDPARLPELVRRAYATAMNGRPGPVVLALPEDVLRATADVADAKRVEPAALAPGAGAIEAVARRLAAARRPLAIVGGGGWSEAGVADLARFLEAWRLPAAAAFRRQGLVDNRRTPYAGHLGIAPDPRLVERVEAADLLLVLGARLGEMTTGGYGLVGLDEHPQDLVHVHPDPSELNRVYAADLAVCAGMDATAEALAGLPPPERIAWEGEAEAAHAAFLAFTEPTRVPGALQLPEVMAGLAKRLPPHAIVTNGAGNYAAFLNRFHRYKGFNSQLAPTSGSMGYGLPAAVAAKLVHPERPVVAFAGDGCLMMTVPELATAVQHDAAVVVVVVNNGMLGTIRMHQERAYPGRVVGTDLKNPDFVAMARAFGAEAFKVERTEAFAPALDAALKSGRPALVEVVVDPEALTPGRSLSAIRAAAMG